MQPITYANVPPLLHPALEQLILALVAFVSADRLLLAQVPAIHVLVVFVSVEQTLLVLERVKCVVVAYAPLAQYQAKLLLMVLACVEQEEVA